MRYLNASREALLGLLDGSIDPRNDSRETYDLTDVLLPRDGLTFCWSNFDDTLGHPLPTAIVGAYREIEDLIAWSLTYLRHLSPITSYIRLIDVDLIRQFNSDRTRLKGIRQIQAAMLGAIVGEVCAQSRQIIPLDSISLAACYSTLSFAMLRSFRVGYSVDAVDEVPERWLRARKFLDQRSSSIELRPVLSSISRLIESCEHFAPQQLLFDRMQTDKLAINLDLIDLLEPGAIRQYSPVIREMQNFSAEDRVRLFEVAAREATREGRREASLVVAVLAACCRPGNLSTMRLLSQFLSEVPDAPVWFGLVQGLLAGGDVLEIANGLGLRIFRDLNQPEDIISRPKSDVQLEELLIFSRSHNGVRPIRSEMRGRVVVDVLPGVPIIVPVPERKPELDNERQRNTPEHQQGLFDRNTSRRTDAMANTAERLARLETMVSHMKDQLDVIRHIGITTAEAPAKRKAPRKSKQT